MIKSVLFLTKSSLFALLLFTNVAIANSDLKSFPQRTWDINFLGRYFQSTGNFTQSGGAFAGLLDGSSYMAYDVDAVTRYIIPGRAWGVFSEARLSGAQSKSTAATRSNSVFSHLLVGSDYVVYNGSFQVIPEFTFLYPFVRNSVTTDSVVASEGAMEVTGRIIFQKNWRTFRAGTFAGYTYRDEGRSALMPYGVMAEWKFSREWIIGGDLKGYSSVSYDKDSGNRGIRDGYLVTTSGGAQRYFAVNPSLLEFNTWMTNQAKEGLGFQIGFGMPINGASQSTGFQINGGFLYRFKTAESPQTQAPPQFEEEIDDGVNQQLFAPPPPVPDPTPVPSDAAQRKKLKEELDKTEMQIELKPVKKKNR